MLHKYVCTIHKYDDNIIPANLKKHTSNFKHLQFCHIQYSIYSCVLLCMYCSASTHTPSFTIKSSGCIPKAALKNLYKTKDSIASTTYICMYTTGMYGAHQTCLELQDTPKRIFLQTSYHELLV